MWELILILGLNAPVAHSTGQEFSTFAECATAGDMLRRSSEKEIGDSFFNTSTTLYELREIRNKLFENLAFFKANPYSADTDYGFIVSSKSEAERKDDYYQREIIKHVGMDNFTNAGIMYDENIPACEQIIKALEFSDLDLQNCLSIAADAADQMNEIPLKEAYNLILKPALQKVEYKCIKIE
jgi:hypothetical protein